MICAPMTIRSHETPAAKPAVFINMNDLHLYEYGAIVTQDVRLRYCSALLHPRVTHSM
jgi:hypothetical protein